MLTAYLIILGDAKEFKVWSFCFVFVVKNLQGGRQMKESTDFDSSKTIASGILEIVMRGRDDEVGRSVKKDGRSRER